MNYIYVLIIFIFLPLFAIADLPSKQQKEVEHLLDFVRNSHCSIHRNGSKHSGKDAAKHIKKKYDYFIDDIKTTEDFIRYSATKSTMSGKLYEVMCPNKNTIYAKTWLLDELKSYRKTKSNLLTNKD